MGGVQRVKLGEHIAERPARARVQVPGIPQVHTLEAPAGRQNREGEAGQPRRTTSGREGRQADVHRGRPRRRRPVAREVALGGQGSALLELYRVRPCAFRVRCTLCHRPEPNGCAFQIK